MCRWVRDYVDFLENDPVAKYARMMGNFVATNVDEQLIAGYLYLSTNGGTAEDRDAALKIAHWSSERQKDQIVDGEFVYERPRQRSLDFSQQALLVRHHVLVSCHALLTSLVPLSCSPHPC